MFVHPEKKFEKDVEKLPPFCPIAMLESLKHHYEQMRDLELTMLQKVNMQIGGFCL